MGEAFTLFRRETGQKHPDDNWPYTIPKGSRYLLEWFWELSPGRPIGPTGPMGLPAQEIQAWAGLKRLRLRAWEFMAIRRLDAKILEVLAER